MEARLDPKAKSQYRKGAWLSIPSLKDTMPKAQAAVRAHAELRRHPLDKGRDRSPVRPLDERRWRFIPHNRDAHDALVSQQRRSTDPGRLDRRVTSPRRSEIRSGTASHRGNQSEHMGMLQRIVSTSRRSAMSRIAQGVSLKRARHTPSARMCETVQSDSVRPATLVKLSASKAG
jgi:hypothetical protein